MATAGDEHISSIIVASLSKLETFDGGSLLMNRLDSMDGSDLRVRDCISIISTFRQLMSRLHYYNLILFFRDCPLDLENVGSLLTYHSQKIKQSCGNIFIAILHAYSFLDILTIFCKYKDLAEFEQERIHTCCKNMISYIFKEDFEIKDCMKGFGNFLDTPDMDAIFNFVKSCYIEEGFFATQIPNTSENKFYGKNFKEPSEILREKILTDYLPSAPKSLRNNLVTLEEALESVTSPDSSEDLNRTERTDFSNLLNWHVK